MRVGMVSPYHLQDWWLLVVMIEKLSTFTHQAEDDKVRANNNSCWDIKLTVFWYGANKHNYVYQLFSLSQQTVRKDYRVTTNTLIVIMGMMDLQDRGLILLVVMIEKLSTFTHLTKWGQTTTAVETSLRIYVVRAKKNLCAARTSTIISIMSEKTMTAQRELTLLTTMIM